MSFHLKQSFCQKWGLHIWSKPVDRPLAGYRQRRICKLCEKQEPVKVTLDGRPNV